MYPKELLDERSKLLDKMFPESGGKFELSLEDAARFKEIREEMDRIDNDSGVLNELEARVRDYEKIVMDLQNLKAWINSSCAGPEPIFYTVINE